MGTLTVRFVGVQAYVPVPKPGGTGSTLRVYMPNGTKLGKSDQGAAPRHFPMVWRENNRGRLIKAGQLRQFPWFKAVLELTPEAGKSLTDLDLGAIPAATQNEAGRLKMAADRLTDPLRLAGVVELDKGDSLSLFGPLPDGGGSDGKCRLKGWGVRKGPVGRLGLFHKLEIEVRHVKKATVRFSHVGYDDPFVDIEPPQPVEILQLDKLEPLLIGNVCAETLLGWPYNWEENVADRDFEWIYQLVDPQVVSPRPLPQMSHNGGGVKTKDSFAEIAEELSEGGGGGSGCQCQGCTGDGGG